ASVCSPPSEALGTILYDGPYDPEFGGGANLHPHQNFTVTIPSSASESPGKAKLGVAHVAL
ncbi:hypothetical protein GGX14DRAFT_331268, partial [Mycena pura]